MREELLCWFALLFTACVAYLWVDLLHERREARRAQKHKQNTQTPSAAKSRENAEKRPQRTEGTPAGGTTPSVAADAAPPPSMREARTTPPALRATSPYTGEAHKARELYDITGRELPTFAWRAPGGRLVRLLPPAVRVYRRAPRLLALLADGRNRTPETLRVIYDTVLTVLCRNADGYRPDQAKLRRQIGYTAAATLLAEFINWIADVLKDARYRLPSSQNTPKDEDEIPVHYSIQTAGERSVSAYSGLTVPEVLDLSVIDFRILRRDAYIYGLSGSKKGREYLEAAWCEEQTQPDRAALRAQFGGR